MATEVPNTNEVGDPVKAVEAANKADISSPEFIIAVIVIVLFAGAYFGGVEVSGDLRGALISAMSMAVSYFLSTQRRKPTEP